MAGWEDLAIGIIEKAADDYRISRRYLKNGKTRSDAEWQLKHIKEMIDRAIEFGTYIPGEKGKDLKSPFCRIETRAHRKLGEVVRHETRLMEVTDFFKSGWFQTLGGTPDIFEKLKREPIK